MEWYKMVFILVLKNLSTYFVISALQCYFVCFQQVAVVRHDRNTQVPFVISRLSNNVNDPRTVPVCDDIIVELEQFVTSVTENPAGNEVNHTQGFLTGLGLFSDSNDTGGL